LVIDNALIRAILKAKRGATRWKKQQYTGLGFARYARGFVTKTHIARATVSIAFISAVKLMLAVITQTDGTNYSKSRAFNRHGETQSFNIPMSYGSMIKSFGSNPLT
jgi:hypothetical protein